MLEYNIPRRRAGDVNMGRKHTRETIEKMSKAQMGEKNHTWKGGKPHSRFNLKYTDWRTAVFEKNNYGCKFCGDRSSKDGRIELNAHHIKYYNDYPELRFDVNNGITLCKSCHNSLHWDRIKLYEV